MLKVIFETSHLKSVFLGYFSLICGFIFFIWVYFSRDFLLAKPTEYGPNERSELSSKRAKRSLPKVYQQSELRVQASQAQCAQATQTKQRTQSKQR